MKKMTALMLSAALVFSMTACSNAQQNTDSDPVSSEESSQAAESTPAQTAEAESLPEEDNGNVSDTETASTETENGESNILIAYFTYGENAELPDDVDASATASIQIFNGEVTGNTGVMARMIAEASGGELFSIQTVEPYPDSYDETIDVGENEKNNGIRPELSTHIENLDQYDTVFVGFPNWWYVAPTIINTFLESYDFSGKTIIPFATSGGSGMGRTNDKLKSSCPGAALLQGRLLKTGLSEDSLKKWVEDLNL